MDFKFFFCYNHTRIEGGCKMGLLDHMLNNVVGSMSRAVGNAVGDAVGNMAGEGINSVTTDLKIKNEEKLMDLAERQKEEHLPMNCPHCGAPTNKHLVCEYCHCKVVE